MLWRNPAFGRGEGDRLERSLNTNEKLSMYSSVLDRREVIIMDKVVDEVLVEHVILVLIRDKHD